MTLDHYTNLLFNTAFPIYFKNTVIVTVCTVAISMVVSILAAYSLARMRFLGSSMLATGVFLSYLVPETLLFIPLFKIVGGLHLLNTYWGLVLVYPIIAVPFCTWILIGYFSSIPRELDEAALIDGCNHFQMLIKIFIPVALPGIIAATIFAFTVSWAEFLYPLAFIYSENQLVLTAGTVTTLIRGDVYHWGGLMAGRAAGGRTAGDPLRLPDGLLHRRPDLGRDQGLSRPAPDPAAVASGAAAVGCCRRQSTTGTERHGHATHRRARGLGGRASAATTSAGGSTPPRPAAWSTPRSMPASTSSTPPTSTAAPRARPSSARS